MNVSLMISRVKQFIDDKNFRTNKEQKRQIKYLLFLLDDTFFGGSNSVSATKLICDVFKLHTNILWFLYLEIFG